MTDHVVLLTGAAGALGSAVAVAFAERGARLALVDLHLERAQATAAGLGLGPERVLASAADLTKGAEARAWVAAVQAAYGRADVLVNIAGGFKAGTPVHELGDTDFEFMLDINLRTTFNACRAVVPLMLSQGGGKIVNVGARGGLTGGKNSSAYGIAKAGVHRLTESLSAELRDANINVNAVLPSILDTAPNRAAMPQADPAKWVAPADLAQVIVFLASDQARAIHGALIPVNGLS
jgi:NAD(P)-dependent dehydrogenase (short-subunit alcohol dehydrogenase family)